MSGVSEREILATLSIDRGAARPPRLRWVAGAGLLLAATLAAVPLSQRATSHPEGVGGQGVGARALGPEEARIPPRHAFASGPVPGSPGAPLHPRAASAVEALRAAGYVAARRRAIVSAPVPGRLAERSVEPGDVVAQGDVLARVDDAAVRARWRWALAGTRAAQSALVETEVRVGEARRAWERRVRLQAQGAESASAEGRARAELDARLAQLAHQRDRVAVARRRAGYWEQELRRHTLRAPFDGMVVSVDAEVGEAVAPVPDPARFARVGVLTLVDMDSLEVEVDVAESQIAAVVIGAPVEIAVDALAGLVFPGRVAAITPVADRRRATFRVRVAFDSADGRVRPEMGARVTVFGFDPPEPEPEPEPGSKSRGTR